jgi:hypothetical protein
MSHFHSPIYVPDLRSGLSCAKIACAAPSSQISILVRATTDTDEPPVLACGELSDDRSIFRLTVVTGAGTQSRDLNYADLLRAIKAKNRPQAVSPAAGPVTAARVIRTAQAG